MIDLHRQTFKEEANELLIELEASLLELDAAPADAELIGRVFRAMHTIKGSGAMFGFDDIASFTHEVETIFDMVRNGRVAVSGKLINLTLAACDQIKAMLDADSGYDPPDRSASAEIVAALQAMAAGGERVGTQIGAAPETQPCPAAESTTYRVRFRPAQGIFMTGANPIPLLDELRELGPCLVVAQWSTIPPLDALDPELCYVHWDIILTTDRGINAIRDVFIFVEDDGVLQVEPIDGSGSLDNEADYRKLGEILVERGDLSQADLGRVLAERKLIGEMLVELKLVEPARVESALAEQRQVKEVRQKRQGSEEASSIRVPAERLDTLVNLVGELVTVQARLSQTAAGRTDAELSAIAEEVERLTAELRDNALNIRMLPIGTTFSKFQRLVRDLSAELGKEVEMVTSGAETELDKTVIERLNDPLVHIIRNSIDHGIEPPDRRLAAGKKSRGIVHLAAVHSGDSVIITIRDDGAGLDREKIRAKGVERGLIPPHAELLEKEIFALIFAPGFSTAQAVTSVSGRGVGMDVVKRAIDALRGSIEIASRKGEGTTITVRIPLTLAIVESLLVQIGGEHFLFPLALVEECVELTRETAAKSHGRNLAEVRGRIVPYIPLRELFSAGGETPEFQQIVITNLDGERVGFLVDHVIGEHQTVIKSLGRAYRNVEGISGSSILGDGTVALILDLPRLVRVGASLELAA
jgi:two-component system, chemotaxis family, sensor kinase CheA